MPSTAALLAAALDAGADLVGGCPHLEHVFAGATAPGEHTRAATEVLLGVAADRRSRPSTCTPTRRSTRPSTG